MRDPGNEVVQIIFAWGAWKPWIASKLYLIPCLSYQRCSQACSRQKLLLAEPFWGKLPQKLRATSRCKVLSLTILDLSMYWNLCFIASFEYLNDYMLLEKVDSKSLINVSVLLIRENMGLVKIMWWILIWYCNTRRLMAGFWYSYTSIEGNFWCIYGN